MSESLLTRVLREVRSGTYNSAAKGAGWVLVGQAGAMTAALAGVRMLTSSMTPAAYGELALWLTVVSVAQGAVQSPVAQAQLRMFSVASAQGALGAYAAAAHRLGRDAAVVTVAICAMAGVMAPLLGAQQQLGAVLATCAFAVAAGEMGRRTSISIAAQHRALAAAAQAGHEWMRMLLAVLLLHVIAPVAASALLAFSISAVFWVVLQSRAMYRVMPALRGGAAEAGEPATAWRSRLLAYAWPFAAWGVASVLQGNVDRWVAAARGTAADAAMVAIIAQLGVAPITAIAAAVSQFVAPILFARVGDLHNRDHIASARRLVIVLVLGALAVTGLSVLLASALRDVAFRLLVAESFLPAAALWPLGIAIGGVFAASQFASLVPMALNRPAALLPVKIGHAALTVAGSVVGATLAGLRGVLWGAFVSNCLAALWTFLIAWRVSEHALHATPTAAERER
jgi:O-antigen/teichoic acid export membrane protein